ncbi:MAG: DUF4012 domain-containing protein [Candidatus Moranbacteria bacterium]|nr:DUF4012 domain-containing protein [Candidatus Moranbacteria bacterium]
MSKRKQILKQMFDVRPTHSDGSLDLEKIQRLKKTVFISEKIVAQKPKTYKKFSDIKRTTEIFYEEIFEEAPARENDAAEADFVRRPNIIQLGQMMSDDLLSVSKVSSPPVFTDYKNAATIDSDIENSTDDLLKKLKAEKKKIRHKKEKEGLEKFDKNTELSFSKLFFSNYLTKEKLNYGFCFVSVLLIFSLLIPGFSLLRKGLDAKSTVIAQSQEALGQFARAKENISSGQLDKAAVNFEESYELLNSAHQDISEIGGKFSEILRFIPGISKVASANYLMAAGENLALSGKYLATSAKSINQIENPLKENNISNQPPLTDIFIGLRDGIESANKELCLAQESLSKVDLDDLPEEIKPEFIDLKNKLPIVTSNLQNFLDYSRIFLDVLGYNGPRKFLFLFQNNQEMRATGGFIGSYGILDITNGRIKNLFVDDIYNPDGQLQSRIIPPEPIQKMSAVWTMHDANWFPDFPASAEKVASFYEKTGGPTVDGIISITPNLLQDLLEITGPIEMPEYDTTVDKSNFVEKTQNEVEVEYDKELNKPKKFIADLTPKILDKVFSSRDLGQMVRILEALNSSLKEKHLLLYSKNYNIQKLISGQGWSGEILNTGKDYLSVINTNINGYKTDGVIDETIKHSSEIQKDGSIIDTMSVTRKHNGGNKEQDWWNRVNSDYMRVYVPEGSSLLEASGQTREFVSPPLDYRSLGFKKDPQLQAEEDSTEVDEKTGTRIYTENHKTVFANWTYVSPGETMVLEYKYRLPFKLSFDDLHHPADSFSVLYQKQSGSQGSKLMAEVKMPENYKTIWHWPDDAKNNSGSLKMETILNKDKFIGLTLEKNQ